MVNIDWDNELSRIRLIKGLKANPELQERIQQLQRAVAAPMEFLMERERRRRIVQGLLEIVKRRRLEGKEI